MDPIIYGALAHIALSTAIGFLSRLPENFAKKKTSPIRFPSEKARDGAALLLTGEFGLTRREVEVALLLLAGYSNQWIAQELFISQNTAKFHTKNIFSKMGVKSRSQMLEIVFDSLQASSGV